MVALENQDQASVQLLLKAGANPLQDCEFSEDGEPRSLLSLAAKSTDKELFRDLLRATNLGKLSSAYEYDSDEDPLYVKSWASGHSSEDVLRLADQCEALRAYLFCFNDISGTSYYSRTVLEGPISKIHQRNDNFLKKLNQSLASPLKIHRNCHSSAAIPVALKLDFSEPCYLFLLPSFFHF